MSYARFGCDDSDVYLFITDLYGQHVMECCGCYLIDGCSHHMSTFDQIIGHLEAHSTAGHNVVNAMGNVVRLRHEIEESL